MVKFLFWFSGSLIFLNFLGYGLIISIFYKKKTIQSAIPTLPKISVIVPIFQEVEVLQQKIKNLAQLNYPKENLEVIIVEDEVDANNRWSPSSLNYKIIHHTQRVGKAIAVNVGVAAATNDWVLITDANTFFNADALLHLAAVTQSGEYAAVAGAKKVLSKKGAIQATGESTYWKYESWLKQADFNFHSALCGAGELLMFKKSVFEPLPENTILDDFLISFRILQQKHKIAYQPKATAVESASLSLKDEWNRKKRIGAGAAQFVHWFGLFPSQLSSKMMLILWIRRIIRWFFIPLLALIFLITNYQLYQTSTALPIFYSVSFLMQCFAYVGLGIGLVCTLIKKELQPFSLMAYVFILYVALQAGIISYLFGWRPYKWKKAARA